MIIGKDKLIQVFIAEDMHPARELLIEYIIERKELQLAGIGKTGNETVKKLSELNIGLLFLDINFPDISGIDVLKKIKKHPYIVFTTSYDKYAIKAFEIGAVDYLLKPFSQERFNAAVDKVLQKIKNNDVSNLNTQTFAFSFKEKGVNHIIPFDEIIFFSSEGRRSIIHTEDTSYTTSDLLKNVEKQLPHNLFSRIHKQYVVNIKYISRVEYLIGGQFVIYIKYDEEMSLPVGRTYALALKEKLGIKGQY